jgi:hypothetical protein
LRPFPVLQRRVRTCLPGCGGRESLPRRSALGHHAAIAAVRGAPKAAQFGSHSQFSDQAPGHQFHQISAVSSRNDRPQPLAVAVIAPPAAALAVVVAAEFPGFAQSPVGTGWRRVLTIGQLAKTSPRSLDRLLGRAASDKLAPGIAIRGKSRSIGAPNRRERNQRSARRPRRSASSGLYSVISPTVSAAASGPNPGLAGL